MAMKNSRDNPQPNAWFGTKRNFNPKAKMINPRTTFTEFNQPPDFGSFPIHDGNKASKVNGKANANENPNIPTAGMMILPVDASTNIPPTKGAVQENETNTNVKAIKKAPIIPPLSAC